MAGKDCVLRLCLIGAGPRNLATLERIVANLADWPQSRVEIDIVDPFIDQGSQVWRTDQARSLLMNTIACQISLFTDDSVTCVGPVRPGPRLDEWARALAIIDPAEGYPAEILAQARSLGPNDYPSRALYGYYLRWVLARIIATADPRILIRRHVDRVVRLDDGPDGRQVAVLAGGTRLDRLDAVVLAQGHLSMPAEPEHRRLAAHATRHRLYYQPPSSPAEVRLDDIAPGQAIALRGMGLNFFDYLTLLCEGRGGRFTGSPDQLRYLPSGQEPRLYAGSRRGVPYHARGENQKGVAERHQPLFLTGDVIRRWRWRSRAGDPPRFATEVWPLISREVQAVYYHALIKASRGVDVAARFQREFVRWANDELAVRRLLGRFGVDRSQWWDWQRISTPYGTRHFATGDHYQRWLLDHLRADLREALRGNVDSPLKSALDAMRDLRNEVRLVVDHGGLAGSSYRDELVGWYTPLNAFVSIGPPARRIAEMIALIESGVLRVLGPGMRVATDAQVFQVWSQAVPEPATSVSGLIEARLPEFDVRRTDDPLTVDLRRRGGCRPYRIPDPTGDDYETGGMWVSQRPYRLVDAEGRSHPRRFAFGVPTETVHWVTAAGIRPGVDSVTLADADAIARACLAFAGPPRQARRSSPFYLHQHIPLAWLPTTAANRTPALSTGGGTR
ncbi:FAD/NAD(P)-binding protein [Solwaraspora sp. WMMD791]|uniref:FAD/NAD(P)-binding protein n=1 Tax=Solwaraspora sp. WMMD791 TaxID=3016086 RepID=UPI00249CA198|nr:FAD/NAD(P)-binding protein [Solwaraspora sp. WMMD791]WFE30108.1 FAD/NAD(P)-binding protein [Solwaraspora sp. WMMD791]